MTAPRFLCALDLVDSIRVSTRWSSVRIWGWIIATDGTTRVEKVSIECDGKGPYPTSFPEPRPDVGRHYPALENSDQSGFVTGEIPLERERDECIDITVIARCEGVEHRALTRRVRLIWFDPENELFALGRIGPFRFPEEIDESRLARYPDCAPIFLLGAHALSAQIPYLADGTLFLDLVSGVVTCHDVYVEYRRNYFAHIEDHVDYYAVGRFDIYAVLNQIIAAVHAGVLADAAGARPAYVLSGARQLLLIPMIAAIYPGSQFIHLRQAPSPINEPSARWSGRSLRRVLATLMRAGKPDMPWRAIRSTSVFPKGDRYAPCEDPGTHGRSFSGLLATLIRAGRHDIREIDFAGVGSAQSVESLLSGLGIERRSAQAQHAEPDPGPQRVSPQTRVDHLRALREFAGVSPIFVLGAGRSGTSAMVGALNAAGIEGFSEGHLFPMLNEMTKRLARRYRNTRVPRRRPAIVEARARVMEAIVRTAVESAYGSYGRRLWLDKTPDHPMIECMPLLRTLFPQAKFLMVVRHPVAFAESRRRKFGESVASAISEWARSLRSWEVHKRGLAASQYLEVDLTRLQEPARMQELCAFLQLGDAQRKNLMDYLASERPELTRVPPELTKALEGLEPERAYNLRSIFYSMLNNLGDYAENARWDRETTKSVDEILGTLPGEHGYRMHMPEHHLEALVVQWARMLEEYRYTAEYHEKNSAYWADVASKRKNFGS